MKLYFRHLSVILLIFAFTRNAHAQRQWYDPRLRRYEFNRDYNAGYGYGYGATPLTAPLPSIAQFQVPNYQLYNYQRPANYEQWQQNYQAQTYQPHYYQTPRAIAPTSELSKYRYEGNYIQRIPGSIPAPAVQQTQRRMSDFLLQPPVSFANAVLHVEPPPLDEYEMHGNDYQLRRRYPKAAPATTTATEDHDALASESIARNNERQQQTATATSDTNAAAMQQPRDLKETRYFHDIYMRYSGPHSRRHGHVELQPNRSMRRFETQHGSQRFKGEVFWSNAAGDTGSHRWNLAQGKL